MGGDPEEVNLEVDDACNESASAHVVNVSIMINGVILEAMVLFWKPLAILSIIYKFVYCSLLWLVN